MCNRFFPLVLLYLTWLLVSEARLPLAPMAATHLVAFFVIAILCHGALAADRPAATHLTDFYLSLAIGGALGGVFNSLLAPLLFKSVIEYPIALACGILLLTFTAGHAAAAEPNTVVGAAGGGGGVDDRRVEMARQRDHGRPDWVGPAARSRGRVLERLAPAPPARRLLSC